MKFDPVTQKLLFPAPLVEAVIVDRPNRFIVNAMLGGKPVRVHCPVTGKIGGFPLNGLRCLLSEAPPGSKRSTSHTMEAIAVEPPDSPKFQWIGINQTAANRYVEAALTQGLLSSIPSIGSFATLKREPKLGSSRLDFLLDGHTYLEVKMPVKNLQVDLPPGLVVRDASATGTERMLRQVRDLMDAMASGEKALLFTVFAYDNPGFVVPKAHNGVYSETLATMQAASAAGLERWQLNFALDPKGVCLSKVMKGM